MSLRCVRDVLVVSGECKLCQVGNGCVRYFVTVRFVMVVSGEFKPCQVCNGCVR